MLTKPIFAGNWKMHMAPQESERFLADFLPRCTPAAERTVVFFPPAISL